MTFNPSAYPAGWAQFSAFIRFARANGRCECTGECGLHGGPTATHRCTEVHHTKARWARGTVRLTTAHLCTCDPRCANPAHVKALCQRCHLRFDRFRHAAKRLAHQRAKNTPQNTRVVLETRAKRAPLRKYEDQNTKNQPQQ
jgi:hypothetical protein